MLTREVIERSVRHGLLLALGELFEPLPGGRIVVGAGVDDGVTCEVLWQMRIVFMSIEAKSYVVF